MFTMSREWSLVATHKYFHVWQIEPCYLKTFTVKKITISNYMYIGQIVGITVVYVSNIVLNFKNVTPFMRLDMYIMFIIQ